MLNKPEVKRIPKYFFNEGSSKENVYDLEYFKKYLPESNGEIILREAVREFHSGFFYCSEFGEVGESAGSECGKLCNKYQPRNGKNGRCRYSQNTFVEGDRIYILSKDGIKSKD